jgi:2-hydroxy-3-keto-5-methylthiopentenyl-1-phosphate phosphatase
MKTLIAMDFDGTISVEEVSVALLERFAEDDWNVPYNLHVAGEIGLEELMRRQFAMIRRPREELVRFVQETTIVRPGFEEFVRYCKEHGVSVNICSAGMDVYVEATLAMLDIPPIAIGTVGKSRFGEGGIDVRFPQGRDGLDFKATFVKDKQNDGYHVVYVGDGISDFGGAKVADFVFARDSLLELCRESGIPHMPFDDFRDVQRGLKALLADTDK